MRSGDLDRRIVIQSPNTGTRNSFGEFIPSWTAIGTTWPAQYTPVRDSERFANSEATAAITARFLVRWCNALSTVDERHRIVFDGRTWDIVAVKEVGRREGLEISATARGERG